mgnify:FL=1|jgi:hypothetical protein|tara:strand:- start:178 stop:363 length:186 start_codon:yes stop_codon:yes gene_type:complete
MVNKKYTLKDLQKATGSPVWLIQYLKGNNRLPIAKESPGRGYPTLYKPEAVDVINQHLERH